MAVSSHHRRLEMPMNERALDDSLMKQLKEKREKKKRKLKELMLRVWDILINATSDSMKRFRVATMKKRPRFVKTWNVAQHCKNICWLVYRRNVL
jgi:hypothetical protein